MWNGNSLPVKKWVRASIKEINITILRAVILVILAYIIPCLSATAGGPDGKIPQFDGFINDVPAKISAYRRPTPNLDLLNSSRQAGSDFFTRNLKAFIISASLINSLEVKRRAGDQGLTLSPENSEALTQETLNDFNKFESSVEITQLLDRSTSSAMSNDVMKKVAGSDETKKVIKSFVLASIHSINTPYVSDLVGAAARLVLGRPEKFGGLDAQQPPAIKLLFLRSGALYFFHGLVSGGPETRSVFLKVFQSLQTLIETDSVLREVLWSHLEREGELKDGNFVLKAFSIISSLDNKYFLWDHRNTEMYLMQIVELPRLTAAAFFAVSVSEFMPDWISDTENFVIQMGQNEIAKLHGGQDTLRITDLKKYLVFRRQAREKRLTDLFSMMKVASDRIDCLNLEKAEVNKYRNESGNIFSSMANGHFLSFSLKMREENLLLDYYQKLFSRSARHVVDLYTDSQAEMTALASEASGADKDLLIQETENLKFLGTFVSYFISSLDEKWNNGSDAKEYWASREAMDQISFWGFPEIEFLSK